MNANQLPYVIKTTKAEKVETIIAHLCTALIQWVPSDDRIIIEHVREARDLACELREEMKESAA